MESYPYPVASSVASAFAITESTGYEAPYLKFDALISCFENIMRFIGIITVQELLRFLESPDNKNNPITQNIKNWFLKDPKILRPSFGFWFGISKDIFHFFKKTQWKPVIPEMMDLFNKSFIVDIKDDENWADAEEWTVLDAFNWSTNFRNDVTGQHLWDKNKVSPKQMTFFCNIASTLIKEILKSMDFLSMMTFAFIHEIKLKKLRRKKPIFTYVGKDLKGSSFYPQRQDTLESMSYYKETECILAKYENEQEYLNLFPFYIYQFEDIKCADIFYFAKAERHNYLFMGVGMGGALKIHKDPVKNKLTSIKQLRAGFSVRVEEQAMDEGGKTYRKSIPGIFEELDYIITRVLKAGVY